MNNGWQATLYFLEPDSGRWLILGVGFIEIASFIKSDDHYEIDDIQDSDDINPLNLGNLMGNYNFGINHNNNNLSDKKLGILMIEDNSEDMLDKNWNIYSQIFMSNESAQLLDKYHSLYREKYQDHMIFLRHIILSNINYEKKSNTIIWDERTGEHLALSFQEPEGCKNIYEQIIEYQQQSEVNLYNDNSLNNYFTHEQFNNIANIYKVELPSIKSSAILEELFEKLNAIKTTKDINYFMEEIMQKEGEYLDKLIRDRSYKKNRNKSKLNNNNNNDNNNNQLETIKEDEILDLNNENDNNNNNNNNNNNENKNDIKNKSDDDVDTELDEDLITESLLEKYEKEFINETNKVDNNVKNILKPLKKLFLLSHIILTMIRFNDALFIEWIFTEDERFYGILGALEYQYCLPEEYILEMGEYDDDNEDNDNEKENEDDNNNDNNNNLLGKRKRDNDNNDNQNLNENNNKRRKLQFHSLIIDQIDRGGLVHPEFHHHLHLPPPQKAQYRSFFYNKSKLHTPFPIASNIRTSNIIKLIKKIYRIHYLRDIILKPQTEDFTSLNSLEFMANTEILNWCIKENNNDNNIIEEVIHTFWSLTESDNNEAVGPGIQLLDLKKKGGWGTIKKKSLNQKKNEKIFFPIPSEIHHHALNFLYSALSLSYSAKPEILTIYFKKLSTSKKFLEGTGRWLIYPENNDNIINNNNNNNNNNNEDILNNDIEIIDSIEKVKVMTLLRNIIAGKDSPLQSVPISPYHFYNYYIEKDQSLLPNLPSLNSETLLEQCYKLNDPILSLIYILSSSKDLALLTSVYDLFITILSPYSFNQMNSENENDNFSNLINNENNFENDSLANLPAIEKNKDIGNNIKDLFLDMFWDRYLPWMIYIIDISDNNSENINLYNDDDNVDDDDDDNDNIMNDSDDENNLNSNHLTPKPCQTALYFLIHIFAHLSSWYENFKYIVIRKNLLSKYFLKHFSMPMNNNLIYEYKQENNKNNNINNNNNNNQSFCAMLANEKNYLKKIKNNNKNKNRQYNKSINISLLKFFKTCCLWKADDLCWKYCNNKNLFHLLLKYLVLINENNDIVQSIILDIFTNLTYSIEYDYLIYTIGPIDHLNDNDNDMNKNNNNKLLNRRTNIINDDDFNNNNINKYENEKFLDNLSKKNNIMKDFYQLYKHIRKINNNYLPKLPSKLTEEDKKEGDELRKNILTSKHYDIPNQLLMSDQIDDETIEFETELNDDSKIDSNIILNSEYSYIDQNQQNNEMRDSLAYLGT